MMESADEEVVEGLPNPPTQPVVTIKHGKDPEVQEVNIAQRLQQNGALLANVEHSRQQIEELKFSRKLKKSRSMTTKSTMTNEDDYTNVHTNTPCTSPASSVLEDNADDHETNDAIEVGHKIVGWKITPRVHFPPPNTINASSLRTSEPPRSLPQADSRDFSISIEPPYVHRPDRTLIVHQTKPMPLQPVKAWPGYGGNVYFQAFQVDTKPIGDRSYSSKTPVPRSNSVSGSRLDKSHTETDTFSVSKFSSFYRSSPSLLSTRKSPSRVTATRDDDDFDKFCDQNYPSKMARRKMARLDKNYILGLHNNGQMTEDLSWISGMDSLGTLKIGNPLYDVKRQSKNETFNRHTFVEKIPRNFVFHPTKHLDDIESIVQPKIKEKITSLTIRKYLKSHGIPDWALKQFVEKYYRDDRGRLRLPAIGLRVKGEKAPLFGLSNESSINADISPFSERPPLFAESTKRGRGFYKEPEKGFPENRLSSRNHLSTNSLNVNLASRETRLSNVNELLIDVSPSKRS